MSIYSYNHNNEYSNINGYNINDRENMVKDNINDRENMVK